MRCNALPLGPAMPYLLTFYVLDLCAALVSTYSGSVSLALLPDLERLPTRTHSLALQKSVQPENTTVSPFSPLPEWEAKFLKTSMAHSTTEAYEYVRHLYHVGRIADTPSDKKRKAATALLRDATRKRDFSLPIVARASKILGPISRHLTAQIIPMICNAARASHPTLAVAPPTSFPYFLPEQSKKIRTTPRLHLFPSEKKPTLLCLKPKRKNTNQRRELS